MNLLALPVQFLLCLTVDAFLALAWFAWVSAKAAGRAGLGVRLLAAGTLFWAQLALVGLALGIGGIFTRPAAILLNLAIAATLIYLCRPTVRYKVGYVRRPHGLAEWAMCSVVALAGLLVAWFA